MSDLAEAIEWLDHQPHAEAFTAAQELHRVLEGEQVQWCETHDNWPGHRQDTTACSIVPKLLVDV